MYLKHIRKRTQLPATVLVLLQLLLTGAVLCVFALFHHVIPYYQRQSQGKPEPIAIAEREEETESEVHAAEETEESSEPEVTAEPEETEEPAPTEKPGPPTWAELFAEQLAEEPTWEEMSYRSPNLAVNITKYEYTDVSPDSVYYAADIYLTDIEQLRSIFPSVGTYVPPLGVVQEHNAILAVNSDVFANQSYAFVVRDGELYNQNKTAADICVLYRDGTMATYGPRDYETADVIEAEPWQIWHFGPMLLDEKGEVPEEFNISGVLKGVHPRTAIGYYEPGHYVFVVVDGRQNGYSRGVDIQTMAAIMKDLGCVTAYNLDGGASSVMFFNGELVNHPCGDRSLNDLVAILEPAEETPEEAAAQEEGNG